MDQTSVGSDQIRGHVNPARRRSWTRLKVARTAVFKRGGEEARTRRRCGQCKGGARAKDQALRRDSAESFVAVMKKVKTRKATGLSRVREGRRSRRSVPGAVGGGGSRLGE